MVAYSNAPTGGERTVSLDEAERRIGAALSSIGLSPELRSLDDLSEPTAWSCQLWHAGVPVRKGEGLGKGSTEQARVGALFEALEHYLTGPAGFDPAQVEMRSAGELVAGPLGAEASSLVLAEEPDAALACHRYRPLGEQTDELLVPLYLYAPWYVDDPSVRSAVGDDLDYSQLARYSCNSGAAIGVTVAEALVHALNETIERDAFSLLLARAFLGGNGELTEVDPSTLPADLALAHRRAERLTGEPVALLDITTDLGVPTMIAYTAPTSERPHYRGVGTSLSAHYAAWRALTELVQCLLGAAQEDEPAGADLTGLVGHPHLYACGRFDLTTHLASTRMVPYQGSALISDDPRDHVKHLIATLSAAGYPSYHRIVATLPGEVTAVHTIVPGLERFMLITDGLLVLPGPRARAAALGTI